MTPDEWADEIERMIRSGQCSRRGAITEGVRAAIDQERRRLTTSRNYYEAACRETLAEIQRASLRTR